MVNKLGKFRSAIALCIGTLSLLSLSSAHAYSWWDCHGRLRWDGGWTNMAINTTSFPPGSAWDARFQNAMWHWNNVGGSGFNFFVLRDTDNTAVQWNGLNEVYLEFPSPNQYVAITRWSYYCYWFFGWDKAIDEADIGFNTRFRFAFNRVYNRFNTGAEPFDFEGVSLHELGHALGINHDNRQLATMNTLVPNGGPLGHWREWDPIADDRQGVRHLYPVPTSETDIASSVFSRDPSGSARLVSSPTSATRGSQITIEFTFSNLGTSRSTFDIGFYISPDNVISTSDTLLGRNLGAWADPGFSATFGCWCKITCLSIQYT